MGGYALVMTALGRRGNDYTGEPAGQRKVGYANQEPNREFIQESAENSGTLVFEGHGQHRGCIETQTTNHAESDSVQWSDTQAPASSFAKLNSLAGLFPRWRNPELGE